MSDWTNQKLESRVLGEITSDIQIAGSEELKNPLMGVKEESEKTRLKLNIKKKKLKN